VPTYRCYFILGGRVAAVEVIETDTDADAVGRAQALLKTKNRERLRYTGIELWDLDRQVHAYPATAAPPAGSTSDRGSGKDETDQPFQA
jgi:hypothetical protein